MILLFNWANDLAHFISIYKTGITVTAVMFEDCSGPQGFILYLDNKNQQNSHKCYNATY